MPWRYAIKAEKPMTRSQAARLAALARWGKYKGKGKQAGAGKQPKVDAATARAEKAAAARTEVFSSFGQFGAQAQAALETLAKGGTLDESAVDGMIKSGLVERVGPDGTVVLTKTARQLYNAAGRGDRGLAKELIARAEDAADKQIRAANAKEKAATADAAGEEPTTPADGLAPKDGKEKEEKPKGGGGGGKKEEPEDAKPTDEEKAQAKRDKAQANARALAQDVGLADADVDALQAAADGDAPENDTALRALGFTGDDGMTTEGRRALTALEKDDKRAFVAAKQSAAARLKKEAARDLPPDELEDDEGTALPRETRGDGRTRVKPLRRSTKAWAVKHGAHDQSSHGRRGARGGGGASAYRSARAGGASVQEARAAARDVVATYDAQQRVANINKQLDGQVSDGQRRSLEAERARLAGEITTRQQRTPAAADVGSQEATVRGRQPKASASGTQATPAQAPPRTAPLPQGQRPPLRAPISGDMDAYARFRDQKLAERDARTAARAETLQAKRDDARGRLTQLNALQSEVARGNVTPQRMREIDAELATIRRATTAGATPATAARTPTTAVAPRTPRPRTLPAAPMVRTSEPVQSRQPVSLTRQERTALQRMPKTTSNTPTEYDVSRGAMANYVRVGAPANRDEGGVVVQSPDGRYWGRQGGQVFEVAAVRPVQLSPQQLRNYGNGIDLFAATKSETEPMDALKSLDFHAIAEMVEAAVLEAAGYDDDPPESDDDDEAYVYVYDKYAVLCECDAEWRIDYTIDAGDVVLAQPSDWQRVEKEWKPVRGAEPGYETDEDDATPGEMVITIDSAAKGIEFINDDLATVSGSGVKAIGDGDGWVGGYLVKFGGNGDLSDWRDVFEPSTDFGTHTKTDVWVHHRMLPGLGKRKLTNQAEIGMDDEGVFIKHLLNLRSSYERKLYGMVQADKLGWSSGTAPHLVERKALGDGRHAIGQWPLGLDASYTPIPAGGFGVEARASAMKSLLADAGIDLLRAIYDSQEATDPTPQQVASTTKAATDTDREQLLLECELLLLEAS